MTVSATNRGPEVKVEQFCTKFDFNFKASDYLFGERISFWK